ncbi:MAG: peptidoglycan DD-metalloendopeptidase family protein, partial [Methylophilaceae bacterium]|nr:peptidoglycan DD-metalloendopeptidase family protein [Methylophilaceae bacterium]
MPAGKAAAKVVGQDWRPDFYTVKRGDTLYSIGLEHGYDYKEIAQANNIRPPYTIYVGQQLKLKPASSAVEAVAATVAAEPAGDVVITPLDLGGGPVQAAPADITGTQPQPVASASLPVISGPIALREPYSELALNAPIIEPKPTPVVAPTAPPPTTSVTQTTPTPAASPTPAPTAKPDVIAPTTTATVAGITWSWPTSGKLLAGFNQGGNAKGIDIGGTTGQPIVAAAPGKVIYSGSDLRGYGKLVIVKHNADYLSVYAHNSNILVKEGESVARGQKIAEMGNTDTDRTKLHFEIRRQGKSVDPASYLPANP